MKNILMGILPLAILSYIHLAQAEDTSLPDVSDCKSIKDNTKRLECYDLASKNEGTNEQESVQNGHPEGDVGNWTIQKTQSQIDDSWNVFVSTSSAEPIRNPYGEYVNPSLYATCREGKTELFVNWDVFLGTDQISMIQRIDSEKATQKLLLISTDHKSVFYPGNIIPIAKKLIDSKKLYLQITPYGESPVSATFNLTGLSEALKPLRHACKW